MKRILFLVTVCLAIISLPLLASAGKTKWSNPNYDFSNLNHINIVSTNIVDPVADNFTVDDMATERIITELQTSLEKKGFSVTHELESNLTISKSEASLQTKEALNNTYVNNNEAITSSNTANLKIIAHEFGYRARVIPGHQEARTEYHTEKIKDNKGNWIEREVPRTVYHYVPEKTVYDARIDIALYLVDPETDKIIFSVRDVRERTQDMDTKDMWRRIANSFAQDVEKATKK